MEELTQMFTDLCNQLGIAVSTGLEWVSQYYYYSNIAGIINSAVIVVLCIIGIIAGYFVVKKIKASRKDKAAEFFEDDFDINLILTIIGIIFVIAILCIVSSMITKFIPGIMVPQGGVLMDVIKKF